MCIPFVDMCACAKCTKVHFNMHLKATVADAKYSRVRSRSYDVGKPLKQFCLTKFPVKYIVV